MTLCSLILTVNQGHVRTDPMSLTTNEFKTKISRQRTIAKMNFLQHLSRLGIGTDEVERLATKIRGENTSKILHKKIVRDILKVRIDNLGRELDKLTKKLGRLKLSTVENEAEIKN